MSVVKPLYIYPVPFVFQEIKNIKTNSIYGYEAFIRFDNGIDTRTYVNNCMMTGSTHQLELHTLYNAIKQFKEYNLTGYLFINSFPSECLDVHEIRLLVDEFGQEILSRVVIELLEYPFINQSVWYEKQRLLVKYGMQLSLNAVGEGIFSDLNTILFLNPNIAKLPYSMIHDFTESPERTQYIKNLVEILHTNDIKVLAMGVENVLEFEMLKDVGVDFVQGYYIGMPKVPNAPEFIGDDADPELLSRLIEPTFDFSEDVIKAEERFDNIQPGSAYFTDIPVALEEDDAAPVMETEEELISKLF